MFNQNQIHAPVSANQSLENSNNENNNNNNNNGNNCYNNLLEKMGLTKKNWGDFVNQPAAKSPSEYHEWTKKELQERSKPVLAIYEDAVFQDVNRYQSIAANKNKFDGLNSNQSDPSQQNTGNQSNNGNGNNNEAKTDYVNEDNNMDITMGNSNSNGSSDSDDSGNNGDDDADFNYTFRGYDSNPNSGMAGTNYGSRTQNEYGKHSHSHSNSFNSMGNLCSRQNESHNMNSILKQAKNEFDSQNYMIVTKRLTDPKEFETSNDSLFARYYQTIPLSELTKLHNNSISVFSDAKNQKI